MSSPSLKNFLSSYSRLENSQEDIYHPRKYKINLLGRFMRETREEYPCRLQEISLFELSLVSSIQPQLGEKIVCLIDHLFLLEGHVERHLQSGFILSIDLTSWGRKLLASRLQTLCSKENSNAICGDNRVSPFSPWNGVEIFLNDNEKSRCVIEDLSLFGASVITQARPSLGSEIFLNQIRSRVEAHDTDGITVSFIDITDPKAFRRHFNSNE